jgi:hypothetical protein
VEGKKNLHSADASRKQAEADEVQARDVRAKNALEGALLRFQPLLTL